MLTLLILLVLVALLVGGWRKLPRLWLHGMLPARLLLLVLVILALTGSLSF